MRSCINPTAVILMATTTTNAGGMANSVITHQKLNDLADVPNGGRPEQLVSHIVTLYAGHIADMLNMQHHNDNSWMTHNSRLVSLKIGTTRARRKTDPVSIFHLPFMVAMNWC
jgi:hypothetical protein